MNRTEGLNKCVKETDCEICRAELRGRQDAIKEVREWLTNDHNVTADINIAEFDERFKGEKE